MSRTGSAFPGGAAAFLGGEYVSPKGDSGHGGAAAVQGCAGKIFTSWPAVQALFQEHEHVQRHHW